MTVRDRVRSFICDSFMVDEFAEDQSFLGSGIIDSDADLVPENFDSVERVAAFIGRKLARAA